MIIFATTQLLQNGVLLLQNAVLLLPIFWKTHSYQGLERSYYYTTTNITKTFYRKDRYTILYISYISLFI